MRTVARMEEISGIPAHPLFVHVPVVLLPLAAVLAIVLLIRRAWFERYQWVLLGLVGLGTLGAVLAASSGEELEEAGERGPGIGAHAEAGELARNLSLVFLLVVVAWIVVPRILRRRAASGGTSAPPAWLHWVLAGMTAVVAIGTVVAVIDAGHSGAEQVWRDEAGGDEEGAPVGIDGAPDQGVGNWSSAFSTTSPSAGWM